MLPEAHVVSKGANPKGLSQLSTAEILRQPTRYFAILRDENKIPTSLRSNIDKLKTTIAVGATRKDRRLSNILKIALFARKKQGWTMDQVLDAFTLLPEVPETDKAGKRMVEGMSGSIWLKRLPVSRSTCIKSFFIFAYILISKTPVLLPKKKQGNGL